MHVEGAQSKGKYTEQYLHWLSVLRLREYPPLRTAVTTNPLPSRKASGRCERSDRMPVEGAKSKGKSEEQILL